MPKATLENNQKHAIAYIVKSWPRLSETFVLNEILSIEQRGVRIRIFSVKEPDPGPSHPKVAQVRAEVTYLALWPHWKTSLPAKLPSFRRQPSLYLGALLYATAKGIPHRHFAALRHFFKPGH